jgi:hypothetical protein
MNSELIVPKVINRSQRVEPVRRYPLSAEIKNNKENFLKDLDISQIDFEADIDETKSEILNILGKIPNRCGRNIPPRNRNPFYKNIEEETVFV